MFRRFALAAVCWLPLAGPCHAALTDNLVAYFKLDESSGDAADATGNGNVGANAGSAVAYVAAKINNGSHHVRTEQDFLVDATPSWGLWETACSLSCWIKLTGAGNDEGVVGGWDSGVGGIMIWKHGSELRGYGGSMLENFTWSGGGTTVTDGNWHHIVLTKNGVNGILYHNGSSVATSSSLGNTTIGGVTAEPFVIGSYNNDATRVCNGDIDEVAVWDGRALDASEVTQLYNSGSGLQHPFTGGGASTGDFLLLLSKRNHKWRKRESGKYHVWELASAG